MSDAEPTGSGSVRPNTTRGAPGPGPRPDDERSDGPDRAPLDVPAAPDGDPEAATDETDETEEDG